MPSGSAGLNCFLPNASTAKRRRLMPQAVYIVDWKAGFSSVAHHFRGMLRTDNCLFE